MKPGWATAARLGNSCEMLTSEQISLQLCLSAVLLTQEQGHIMLEQCIGLDVLLQILKL